MAPAAEPAGRSRTFRSAVLNTFLGQLGFFGFALVWSLLTARLLGPSGRGELSILVLIPTLALVTFELGQEFACSHLAARHPPARAGLHGNSALYAGFLLAPSCLIVGLAFWALHVSTGPLFAPAVAGGLAVATGVYFRAASGIALGAERVLIYNIARLLLAGLLPLGVGILIGFGSRSPRLFFYACSATSVCAALFLALVIRKATIDRALAIRQARVGFSIHLSNLSLVLLLRADQVLLFLLATTAAVGSYAVAVNVVETLWYLPAAAGIVSIPYLSGESDLAEKVENLTHVLRVSLWLPAIGAVALAVAAPFALPLIFGSPFKSAVMPLELLLPGVLAMGITRVTSAAMIAKGQTRLMWKIAAVALLLNLALNALLIPPWGAPGAAVSSSAAYIVLGAFLLRATATTWNVKLADCVRMPRRLGGQPGVPSS